jgi:hypothetical protein
MYLSTSFVSGKHYYIYYLFNIKYVHLQSTIAPTIASPPRTSQTLGILIQ